MRVPYQRTWTPEYEAFLRENYRDMPIDVIAESLGFSKSAVYARAHVLGLKRSAGGPSLRANERKLDELDGAVIAEGDVLQTLRKAAGVPLVKLEKLCGWTLNADTHLANPSMRKALDVAEALGFELVLRRKA